MPAITASRAEHLPIGELSRRTGVNIETIRYYERIKMLAAPRRTASGRRVYGAADRVALCSFGVHASWGSRSTKSGRYSA
jgi:MerR family transcriptional regulator, mercuric resistance operon regulatory protein